MTPTTIGRYELKEAIGRGGMATVFRGYDPRFRRDVAVKVMTLDFMDDETLRARFDREAQTIAALEHPAIVPVYDFGEEQNRPYLVMRLMSGGTLTDQLKNGPLSIEETATILRRIGSALERAHQKGIVHRDLKPSNIMFDEYGDAYLADFGIARVTESAVTLTGEAVVGTPAYMSPEQVNGDKALDGRSDIYALGIICFEMLTGVRPFQGDTAARIMMKHLLEPVPDIRQVRPDLPGGTEEMITRALAKNPEERYTRAGELSDTLWRLVHGEPPITPRTLTKPAAASPTPVTPQPSTPTPFPVEATPTEVAPSFPETEVFAPAFARPAPKVEDAPVRGRRPLLFALAGFGLIIFLLIGGLIISQFVRTRANNENEPINHGATEATETEPEENEEGNSINDEGIDASTNADEVMDEFYQSVDAGDYGPALLAINRAITLDDQPWYHHERAYLYLLMDDTNAALAEINAVIAQEPDNAQHYELRGMIYREQGELGKALLEHKRAVEMDPDNPGSQYQLGLTYYAMGDPEKAITHWLLVLDLGVDHAGIFYDLGEAYLALDQPDDALQIYAQGLEQFPDEYGLYNTKASIYIWNFSDADAALAELNRSLELNSEQGEAYAELGQTHHYLLNDLPTALEYYDQAIAHDDQSAWFFYERALCLRELEQYEAAIEDYAQIMVLEPENEEPYLEQGWIYLDNLNQPEMALEAFNQALALNPDHASAHLGRGRAILATTNDTDAALESFSTCITLNPEAYWCYWEMGWLHDTLEQPDEASRYFQLFIDKAPTDDCFACQVEAQAYIDEHN